MFIQQQCEHDMQHRIDLANKHMRGWSLVYNLCQRLGFRYEFFS
jgi:hypothetical protein